MKFYSLFIVFFFFQFGFTQINKNPLATKSASFVKYKYYKEMKKEKTLKIDSLGFFIKDNDTLINISGYDTNKGVKVAYEYKDSEFLKKYESVVFNNIYGKPADIKNARIRYWKEEVKVYIDSTVPNNLAREMNKMFKFLDKEIDSLKITRVFKREKANCFIYFINKPTDIDWEKRINNNSDGAFLSWNGKQQIYNAAIKVNSQVVFNEKQQLMLLKKHFIWSLGFFYLETNNDCKSFFSNCVYVDKELNDKDLEILKYHYSYGICKGTDLETFENNHKDAQEVIRQNPKNKFYFTHLP